MLPRTFLFMLACAVIGYLLGRTRGMGLQGFFLGLAFGPLGWGLILLWPTSWIQGPYPRGASGLGRDTGGPGGPGGGTDRAFGTDRTFRSGPSSSGEEAAAGPRGFRSREGSGGPGCPRCGRAVARDAGACPHCGNVLIPVNYRVG